MILEALFGEILGSTKDYALRLCRDDFGEDL